MAQAPSVSVIIPTFNRSGYLQEAIASVLAQTYGDFEVLVVDDGSTDDTADVVAGIGDTRIIYIRQENAGRSRARNRGLAEARGRYIAFLDDDDLYLSHKLAAQTAYLDAHPMTGLVAGGAQIISVDGNLVREWQAWRDQPHLTLPECLYAFPLLTCSVMFRREWLEHLDEWFDPAMDRAEDTDFWIRMLLAGCRMEWIPEVVCAYRQHSGSSQADGERYYCGYLALLDKLYGCSDLTEDIRAEKAAAYAHYHLIGACHAYAAGQLAMGQSRLRSAVELVPSALEGTPPRIVEQLSGIVQGIGQVHPERLLHTIFANLPTGFEQLRPFRRRAISALHMQRVFTAHSARGRFQRRDWVLGVAQNPAWVKNRGVWSILIKSIWSNRAWRREVR